MFLLCKLVSKNHIYSDLVRITDRTPVIENNIGLYFWSIKNMFNIKTTQWKGPKEVHSIIYYWTGKWIFIFNPTVNYKIVPWSELEKFNLRQITKQFFQIDSRVNHYLLNFYTPIALCVKNSQVTELIFSIKVNGATRIAKLNHDQMQIIKTYNKINIFDIVSEGCCKTDFTLGKTTNAIKSNLESNEIFFLKTKKYHYHIAFCAKKQNTIAKVKHIKIKKSKKLAEKKI